MSKTLTDLEDGLSTLGRYLSDLREAPPQLTRPVLTYLNEPWARALAELPGTYTMVLAHLELLLLSICNSVDPQAAVDAFVSSVGDEMKPGYWSANAIAQGVVYTAVKLGVLQPAERDQLLEQRVWDRKPFEIQECVADLEQSIAFLSSLLEKLKTRLSAV